MHCHQLSEILSHAGVIFGFAKKLEARQTECIDLSNLTIFDEYYFTDYHIFTDGVKFGR